MAQNAAIVLEPGTQPDVVDQPTAPKAMFPYQAVVRDMTNERNLVVNDTVKIVVNIQAQNSNEVLYTETFEKVPTNFNGLVSIVLGKNEQAPKALSEIDWSTSPIIVSTFSKGGETISVVETPVMAVPYALQADNAPVELTTKEICRYLADPSTKKSSVDSVIAALVNNTEVSQRVKDTIINYIKTQKATVKELAYYFLSLATPEDLYDALNHTPAAVKSAAKDTVINYIKAHKDEAMDILAAYLKQVDKNDVGEVLSAIQDNPNAEEIRDTLAKYCFNYIMNHKALVWKGYRIFVDSLKVNEFETAYNYFKTAQNGALYNYWVTKFNGYMNNYLTTNKYLRGVCENDTVTFCQVLERVVSLENAISTCPRIDRVTATKNAAGDKITVTVKLKNVDYVATTIPFSITFENVTDCLSEDTHGYADGVYTYTYNFNNVACETGIPADAKVTVHLTIQPTDECPAAPDMTVSVQ